MALAKRSTTKKRAGKSLAQRGTAAAKSDSRLAKQRAHRTGQKATQPTAKRAKPPAPAYWISSKARVHAVIHADGNGESTQETIRTAFAEYMQRHADEANCALLLKAKARTPEKEARLLKMGWTGVSLGLDRWDRARAMALAAAKGLTLNEFVDQAVLERLPL